MILSFMISSFFQFILQVYTLNEILTLLTFLKIILLKDLFFYLEYVERKLFIYKRKFRLNNNLLVEEELLFSILLCNKLFSF
jgi:hypothetical protein